MRALLKLFPPKSQNFYQNRYYLLEVVHIDDEIVKYKVTNKSDGLLFSDELLMRARKTWDDYLKNRNIWPL